MIQGTSLKFYSKPWVFFHPTMGSKSNHPPGQNGLSRCGSLCHGLCLWRTKGTIQQLVILSWTNPIRMTGTTPGTTAHKKRGNHWISWSVDIVNVLFFFFLKMGFHLLTSSLSRSEDRDGESALFTVKQKTHGHPAHLIFQTISDTPTYPLVICYIAIENGHRNSGFSH